MKELILHMEFNGMILPRSDNLEPRFVSRSLPSHTSAFPLPTIPEAFQV